MKRNRTYACIAFFCAIVLSTLAKDSPQVTLLIYIDQLSYETLHKLKPHLKGGLHQLLTHGIVYTQAHWPHGMPSTATGHTSGVTGCLANMHGIIDNSWLNKKGQTIKCDDDENLDKSAVFGQKGFYPIGKSACNVMVDTITDQFILSSCAYKAFSFSFKSRAAITMAGRMAKAVWFDRDHYHFTSSKAYFDNLPQWLKTFNTQHPIKEHEISWTLLHPRDHEAYHLCDTRNSHQRKPSSINQKIKKENVIYTPQGMQLLVNLVKTAITAEFDESKKLFIALSISSPDKIGHRFGPESIEYYDMLYHLDTQLHDLFNYFHRLVDPKKLLIVFTADHGAMPMPEYLEQKGLSLAQRLDTNKLKEMLNQQAKQKYAVAEIVRYIDTPDVYVNHDQLTRLEKLQQAKLLHYLKKLLQKTRGIKQAWLQKELLNRSWHKNQFEYFYQQQVYPGRSGDIIFQVQPYVYASRNERGTGHKTPYRYDTHIPIIFYHPTHLEKRIIHTPVWGPQIAPTLAQLLDIPRPSACTYDSLPLS